MAYIKYKELTKYFNFRKEVEVDSLPNYVKDYVFDNETIKAAYKTSKDKGIFTNKRIILFDIQKFGIEKTIHSIPYESISSIAVTFTKVSSALIFSMDSGYQIKLKFVNMSEEAKKNLRILYSDVITKGMKK